MSAAPDSGVTYPSYLRLDELLALQVPRSTPQHPDELLFIVVHQASELWFKVILHELEGLVDAMERRETGGALWRIGRVNALMRIVSAQLSSLDTLPPQRFLQFRGYLGTSSGSQSAQFRAIEAMSGLRDEPFLHAIAEHGAPPPAVQRALERPTLQAPGDSSEHVQSDAGDAPQERGGAGLRPFRVKPTKQHRLRVLQPVVFALPEWQH